MRPITTDADLDALLDAPVALLLKHGARCPVSAAARDELLEFESTGPGVPVAGIEVTGEPGLSRRVTETTGIAHESPQLLVLAHGRPAATLTKREISVRAIAEALREVNG